MTSNRVSITHCDGSANAILFRFPRINFSGVNAKIESPLKAISNIAEPSAVG